MKYLIAISIVAAVSAIAIILSKRNETKSVENIWQKLLNSSSIEQEKEHIKQLTSWIHRKDGYIEVIAIDANNTHKSFNDFDIENEQLKHLNIDFYWKNKQFAGKNWTPKSIDNIWVLFRE